MAAKKCPRLNKPCLEHGCVFYINLLGADPQTGEQLNKWGCTDAFAPMLMIEVAKEVRQLAAAFESARNEARKDAGAVSGALLELADEARNARMAPHAHDSTQVGRTTTMEATPFLKLPGR